MASGSWNQRTYFQRNCPKVPKLKVPAVSQRMRSKPMSMMESDTMSVTNTAPVESFRLMLSNFIAQVLASSDHVERN